MKHTTDPFQSSGLHNSYWLDSEKSHSFQALSDNIKCDVVIVGAGIAGLSVAYALTKAGKKVCVIEDGNIASGETGRTSAHLTAALDDRYYELERIFGQKGSGLAAESHMAAIDFVEKVVADEDIRCEFRRVPGYLFLHQTDKEGSLDKEFAAANRAGLNVRMLDNVPGFTNLSRRCIEFADQAQFHPVKYMNGLADAIRKKGGRIFTQTHAKEISDKGIVTDEGLKVTADFIVVATNTPVNNRMVIHLKQFPFRTYIIGALIKKDSLPKALWWDSGNYQTDSEIPPYHYVRTETYNDHFDLLIAGGEDHATGLADAQNLAEEERYARLESWLRSFTEIGEIKYRWSGQVMEPMDSMAYIGHNPSDHKNIFIATGDSGNGLTHGTIAGILIPDLILGKENKWKELYDPSRIKLKSVKTWLKEFGGGFFDYLKYNPHHADQVKLSSINYDEGKIIQLDKEKFGAYRDPDGTYHFVSAECTHVGCIIKWNNDEKSWDCPCHGSRFTVDGKVLNGPANSPLLYWSQNGQESAVQPVSVQKDH